MKLIIDIPDEEYNECIERNEWDTLSLGVKLIQAVQNGTPLPKGHGRLIDVDALDGEWVCPYDGNYECVRECSCANCPDSEYQCYTDITEAPTIIEADKPQKKEGIPCEENDSGYNCENWIP